MLKTGVAGSGAGEFPGRGRDMRRIEDYALIGDCETAALVHRSGSIDWLCWPRFDSEACFASLLGGPENGRWLIAPSCETRRIRRGYRRNTLVLETEFETDDGVLVLTDFMPLRGEASDVVRILECTRGEVPVHMELVLRFGYGERPPWTTGIENHRIVKALSGPHAAVLQSGRECDIKDGSVFADFTLKKGERTDFVLTYGPSHEPPLDRIDARETLDATERYWDDWCAQCSYTGTHSEAVMRSLVTMKALTYRPTGGIVAAPTTSLPEKIGGNRNWDYRFCWLRDATFVLLTLLSAGYRDEAEAWTDWLMRAVAGAPDKIQPLYGVAGESWVAERESAVLAGFEGSAPVRIGNAAFQQLQLDIFGEVMDIMHHARLSDLRLEEADWNFQATMLGHLEKIWREPDEGFWEVRGRRQHFVYSKVMSWVAFDRAVKAGRKFGLGGPTGRWAKIRDEIHTEICERGFDAGKGAFVQAYGSTQLDATALLIPIVGFLPCDDPRVTGTVAAIEKELIDDGLVLRYRSERTRDGLPPGEGAFLACSFWLADNMVLQGRIDEAQKLFDRLLALRNDVGLLSEEYDMRDGRQLGNFPQALSHMSLVDTALNLAHAAGPAKTRSEEGKEAATAGG
jgi:GH15 family glucan-1,4-alpha-glucosidase